MARIRTIKPSFWTDEKLARMPIPARLLYVGTWTIADDNGVLRGNPSFIKSQIFPYDDSLRVGEVSKWIDALVEARMLEPFSYRGESFYKIRTFRSHQKIDTRYPNEIVPRDELREILDVNFSHTGDTAGTRRGHGGRPPQEVEWVYSGKDSHTQGDINSLKNSHSHARESETFRVLTGRWLEGFAPNLRFFKQPLTEKQFQLLRKSYFLADIARIMFAVSVKTDPKRLPDTASVYGMICTYAGNDKRIQEQREAMQYNASLSEEGIARGTVVKRPIPRTTRVSNPELGYIFDYEDD